jgi:hypothetical protein
MCGCNDQALTFETMIADPMFRMLLAADKLRLEDVTALYDTASQALAAQEIAQPGLASGWSHQVDTAQA